MGPLRNEPGRCQDAPHPGNGGLGSVKTTTDQRLEIDVRADQCAAEGYREIRVEDSRGVSNLALIRVDRSTQTPEVEPNDSPDQATVLPDGSAGTAC